MRSRKMLLDKLVFFCLLLKESSVRNVNNCTFLLENQERNWVGETVEKDEYLNF